MDMFLTCLVDGATKSDIIKLYPNRADGAYYLDKFKKYLYEKCDKISLIEYCENYLKIAWPICPVKKIKVGFQVSGKGLFISRFAKGGVNMEHCPAFKKSAEKMSKDRLGVGNPMYGKKPWNFGKTYINYTMRGRKLTDEHRLKLKEARKNSPVKARHTQKHSAETKKILAIRQAEKWAKGVFNRKTSIEVKTEDYLKEINLNTEFVFQHQEGYYSLDFAFPDKKVGIECHGTFFHIDPRFYPKGPICAIQRRNFGRDKAKAKFFNKKGWKIIVIWETEINNGEFKEILNSNLLELGLLEG